MGTSRTFDVRGRAAEATSRRIVEEALEAGANLFDSSPMYGEAERVLGLALDGRRDEAIIATKVWTADDDQAERQIEASLRHAHGRVELYQIHNLVAWPARLERLSRLRDEGPDVAFVALHVAVLGHGVMAAVVPSLAVPATVEA